MNHAAAHHVTDWTQSFRRICRLLPADGWFISFDYVGPHRNQYLLNAWDEAWKLVEELREDLRESMAYPRRDLFVVGNPTKRSIGTDCCGPDRYFRVAEFGPRWVGHWPVRS